MRTSDETDIIKISDLVKNYGDVKAVRGINFCVKKGELFAFLGPNGSGKSTSIDMMCTYLKQDSGHVIIDGNELGKDDDKIREVIGVVHQQSLLDKMLTVRENFIFRGSLYGMKGEELLKRVDEVIHTVGLERYQNHLYGKLSGGQRRRCDIARALINRPKILFLDEPTTGLDPQTRKIVWDTIIHLQKEVGMTIFLTTHYMEEAAVADYIVIIDKGEIITEGTSDELRERYTKDKLFIVPSDSEQLLEKLKSENVEYTLQNNKVLILLDKTLDSLDIINKCRTCIESFEVTSGSMDDVFLEVTGREVRE